jgi:hypothetical protein
MTRPRHPEIRKLLHQYHDGLTALDISERLEIKPDSVRNALQNMPDTYIDRWQVTYHEPPSAVWCAVVPPEDCPKPTLKPKVKNDRTRNKSERPSGDVRTNWAFDS